VNVKQLEVSTYRIPTDRPEADEAIEWNSTTVVLVEAVADSGLRGLGFSYASSSAARAVRETLAPVVVGGRVEEVGRAWEKMVAATRNVGGPGVAATAISAVDVALWDLKAKAAEMPLFCLLNAYRDEVPIYGSGGFTSYSERELTEQLGGWVQAAISRAKMKIGKD
jgi:L-alanine-DL-glutamate epimerase-like enolase superfamily enzyme